MSEFGVAVAEPGAGFADDVVFDAEVEDFADFGDAFAEHEVEFADAERRGDFVFDDFDFDAVADVLVAVFDGLSASDVDADGGVEFEGVAAGGGFGVAEEYAEFFAELVDEYAAAAGFADGGGEFAHGLAHESCLEAHFAVAHFAVDFGFRCECGDGVDDDDVDGAGADEVVGDFECLLAVVWLRDEEVFDVDAEFFGIEAVEGVFGIDESGDAALFLRFGDDVDGEGGFTGGFGAVYFDDAAFWEAADAECVVEADAACGYDFEGFVWAVAELHDGAFAVVFLNLVDGALQNFQLFLLQAVYFFFCHNFNDL